MSRRSVGLWVEVTGLPSIFVSNGIGTMVSPPRPEHIPFDQTGSDAHRSVIVCFDRAVSPASADHYHPTRGETVRRLGHGNDLAGLSTGVSRRRTNCGYRL